MANIDKHLGKRLSEIFGRENVYDGMEERICASYDATKQSALPDVVVSAGNAEQICKLMKLCNEWRVPVYPQGARSGLVGAAVPLEGGVALDMTRMNHIIEIDPRNLTATVEPGVVTADLQKEAEKVGLFYPPDPASNAFSTLGGNVAQGAGGLRCIKYGVTREYVLTLDVVLPTGERIQTGSQAIKDVTGYDLTSLMVGSEGTLGIFTRMVLRLLPLPEDIVTSLAFFRDAASAMDTVSAIIAAKVIPRALEFMDDECARSVQNEQDFDMPSGTGAILLIELDGKKALIEEEMKQCLKIAKSCGAFEAVEAYHEEDREKAWAVRRALSPALYTISPRGKISEDICVPRSELTIMLQAIKEISRKHEVKMACFGHAGDGNLHVNALVDLSDEEKAKRGHAAIREVFETAVSLGGTLSGEHGVGLAKQPYLTTQIPQREMEIMRRIKKLFDPNNVLNPNKIFPPE